MLFINVCKQKIIMRGILFGITLIMISPLKSQAQEAIGSINGTIYINGTWNDSLIVAKSNKLLVLINYETVEFILKVEKSTLKTGIDSLDKKLAKFEGQYFQFEGKLDIPGINKLDQADENFGVSGYLTCNSHQNLISGTGNIRKVGGIYPYNLDMTFKLGLEENDINLGLQNLNNEIQVDIIQTVLQRNF